jgi:tRNA A37 threonylcarbamoyladenosine synthetase subunit TsaC/SUA5/YrdC
MDASNVYLTQTDTTVGFLCNDDKKLSGIKKRPISQKILQVVDSFSTLKQKVRVPNKFKKSIRRSKKTTFIYPNGDSFRVVHPSCAHHDFIKKFKCMYSTSANLTQHHFEKSFAFKQANIIVEDHQGLYETQSSRMIKLSRTQQKKIR